MRRKSSQGRKETDARYRKPNRKTDWKLTEKIVETIQRTPTKSPEWVQYSEWYLQDERFDLIPKTDYTYARSGSYSPRFLGRKYVNPNMSRYRIRGPRSGMMQAEDDGLVMDEFSDDEVITTGRKLRNDDDVDSEDSYEIVYKDGMVLRSGHSLRTLQSMIREHDAKQMDPNTNFSNSSLNIDRNISQRNALTSRKTQKSAKVSKQYSQSERKRKSMSVLESNSASYLRSQADLRARKNLNSQFDTDSYTNTNQYTDSHTNTNQYTRSNLDLYSQSKSGSFSNRDSRSYDQLSARNSKSYDQTDSRSSVPGYSVTTVRTTVTEYGDLDDGREKAERELSEKQTRSNGQYTKTQNQTVDHLYGLDSEDEYSDGSSFSTRRSTSRYSLRNGGSQYSDSSTSITTTVITTITETISTITRPIVTPVWNHVGRPLWKSVGQPITSLISSLISLTLSALWSLVSWPVTSGAPGAAGVVVSVVSWLWNNCFKTVTNSVLSVPVWFWRKLEYISMQLVVLDVWLFKRGRRRSCCLCLPLLLLLPLLFTLLAGTDLSSAKSAFMGFWVREEAPAKPVISASNQYLTQLNEEVRLMILQLQSNTQSQLTAAEVEIIVRRILNSELAALKTTMEGDRNEAYTFQNQVKKEHVAELENISQRHADLVAVIQNLEAEISQQKENMKQQGSEVKEQSAVYLAGLEEKLAALQAELRDLQEKHRALLLRLDDCCKNDTYLAALVHDRVNAILADAMAGHLSGNKGQDAFTHWLHSNYVSREDLDKRLGALAADLTENVIKMMKTSEEAQIAAAVAAAAEATQQQQEIQQRVVVAGNGSGIGAEKYEELQEKEVEKECSDGTKEAQFNTMFYIAKEGQALNQYPRVLSLQMKNKCPDLQDQKKLYSSEEAKNEILAAISDTLEESVDCDINNSEFIGLIIDESTDVTVHKKLNVYVKCLNERTESVIHFMDCINVIDGKAETIVSEIVKVFQRKGISLTKLMTLASDGASVMTGRLNGVGVRLKREFSPHMTQIHCVAHKLALAAGQACRDISLFSEYQQTLKNVYRYFSNSAVRYNELRAMQDLMEDDDMEYLTLKEPASFRWLSLDRAVRAIADCYPALYSTLEHDAAKGNSVGNAEAKGLFNKVKCVTFVLLTGFLRDVLTVVTKLSTVFQRNFIDIETVNIMVESTVVKLNQLKNKNGPDLSKVYEEMKTAKSMYRGVKLTDREQLRMQFQNNASSYLQKLLENIEYRFDKESMKNLQLLNSVLSLSLIPKNLNGLEDHGEEELKQLVEIYGGENGIIDGERASEDYYQLKVVLKSMNGSLIEACSDILKQYKDVFPDFATLATLVLISPVTSVACERGFSVHNKIKTKGRSRLKHETVTKLMRIKEEGPSLEEFDPKPSVKKFCEMRNRRK